MKNWDILHVLLMDEDFERHSVQGRKTANSTIEPIAKVFAFRNWKIRNPKHEI